MTRDEMRAAAKKLTRWYERFAPLFGRKEAQEHSRVYVKGLLSDQKRKSIEPLALQFARGPHGAAATQNEVVALQGFITHSPWKVMDVFHEIQAVFAEELMPAGGASPIGTVARSWNSWHHHMSLVALGHLYVTLTRRDMKHDVPELTLDLALRVLRSTFARPTLSEDEAMKIIDYHLGRNSTAHESHRKSWLKKHKRLAKKLLL